MELLWTDKETELLKELYPLYGNAYLSQLFSRSPSSIKHKGNRLGLKKEQEALRRINSDARKKYDVDDTYFENIDTSDKAYILGFLLGDGSIDKDYFRLSIEINKQDEEVLQYIKNQLKTDAPIGRRGTRVSLRVSSYKLINDLAKYNMVPRKTYGLELPFISDNLYSHLIRGLFDADGCISFKPIKNRKGFYNRKGYHFNIRGTRKVLEKISEIVHFETGIVKKKIYDYDWPIYVLGGRNQISKIAAWLYRDAFSSFFLSRKYNKFIEAGLL